MSSSSSWSPFDCLAHAELTESGLLKRDAGSNEVDLLVVHDAIELRASGKEAMVPLTVCPTTGGKMVVDSTKKASDWVDRECNVTLTVTTHRLVFWKAGGSEAKSRLARFIHLSNVFVIEGETALFKSPKIFLSTAIGELMLVFVAGAAKSNRDETLRQLQMAVKRQLWEQDDCSVAVPRPISRRVGVDAVMSSATSRHRKAAELTETAFDGDAETLLQEAKELVKIIHKYVATLDRNTSKLASDNDTDRFVNMLQDMGMTAALSKADYRGREHAYHEDLARQLCDFLRPKFCSPKSSCGVMTLTDVYCLYNRARATHLISPEDLLNACDKMQQLQLGFSVYTFPGSGLKVLQYDKAVNQQVLAAKFIHMATTNGNGCVTALDVSRVQNVSAVLAYEQLCAVERSELLVRDETLETIRFYPNLFKTTFHNYHDTWSQAPS